MPTGCDNCGLCCLELPLPPFDANELSRAPDALVQAVDDYAKGPRFRDTHPCLWLDLGTGKCRHHQVRPAICRWFEPGSVACNEIRKRAEMPPVAHQNGE